MLLGISSTRLQEGERTIKVECNVQNVVNLCAKCETTQRGQSAHQTTLVVDGAQAGGHASEVVSKRGGRSCNQAREWLRRQSDCEHVAQAVESPQHNDSGGK